MRRSLYAGILAAITLVLIGVGALAAYAWQGSGWSGQYFANPTLSGTPTATLSLPTLNFNLGTAAPAAGVPADGWSARFTSSQVFAAGVYEFTLASDDGARVFINGALVFDRFIGRVLTTETFRYTFPAAGSYPIVVEYFDGIDLAILNFSYFALVNVTPTPPTPTPISTFVIRTAVPRTCLPALPLTIGGEILLVPGVNIRSGPSISAPPVNYYTQTVRLRIEEGPRCGDGYQWWRVSGLGQPGWVAEGNPARYFIQSVDPIPSPDQVCYDPLGLRVGGQTLILSGVRLRTSPSTGAAVLTTAAVGQVADVIDGSRCSDRLNWWRIRVNGVEGWVAEGFPENYWLQPAGARPVPLTVQGQCVLALSLSQGSRVAVTYRDFVPRTLRTEPSGYSGAVASLIDGVALEIISGPVCAESYNWWQVRVVTTDIVGWIAEGRPGNYWFEVLGD